MHCHFTADIYAMQIGPFLTLLGPRNLPALSHQMDQWLSNVWETAFLCKTLVNSLFPTIALLLIFPWYFPEQSGKVILFSVIFHPIFSGFYSSNLSLSHFWAIQFIHLFIRLFIRLFFINCLTFWAVQLFVIFVSCYCYLSNPVWLYVIFIPFHCYKTFLLF